MEIRGIVLGGITTCLPCGTVHHGRVIYPETMEELTEVVRAARRPCAVVGGETKPALHGRGEVDVVGMRHFSGIMEYEPTEYTFTARSGTKLAEVIAALHQHGQYLPFDPLLVDAGATLGGTIAANGNGPGRIRFGGVRDFLVGVQWLNGEGTLLRGGGKVVKNAAGFDFPKLFCGSMGRLGVLTEVTFKVFPQPVASLTAVVECADLADTVERMSFAARQSWEMEALEIFPPQRLVLRMAGDAAALPVRMKRALLALERESRIMEPEEAGNFWKGQREFHWAEGATSLLRIPLTARQVSAVDGLLHAVPHHFSAAGNVAWAAGVEDFSSLHEGLKTLGLTAVAWRGPETRLGAADTVGTDRMVKAALDEVGKFPDFPHYPS